MNEFQGADTTQLRETATLFAGRGEQLRQTAELALRLAQSVDWVGPDADAFRAECSFTMTQLVDSAVRVGEQANDLRQEAEQQDGASEADGGTGGGSSAGPHDRGLLPDVGPWFTERRKGTGSWRDSAEALRKQLIDKAFERAVDSVEKANGIVDGGPPWWRGAKKFIPVLPDAIAAADHALHGETEEFIFDVSRGVLSVAAVGAVDDVSSVVFPMLPDDWMYPGTDVPVNEGSVMDGFERVSLENPDPRMTKNIREGEQFGMDISDRLGIENQYARNLFKTAGGFSSAVGAAHRDPQDDSAWYIGKDLPPFD